MSPWIGLLLALLALWALFTGRLTAIWQAITSAAKKAA